MQDRQELTMQCNIEIDEIIRKYNLTACEAYGVLEAQKLIIFAESQQKMKKLKKGKANG